MANRESLIPNESSKVYDNSIKLLNDLIKAKLITLDERADYIKELEKLKNDPSRSQEFALYFFKIAEFGSKRKDERKAKMNSESAIEEYALHGESKEVKSSKNNNWTSRMDMTQGDNHDE